MKQKISIFMGVVFFAAVVTWLSLAEYTAELRNAYDWAFTNKITTQTSIDGANLYGEITRQSLAKMMVVYSKDMLWKTPDYSMKCNFKDKDEITEDLKWYTIEACQLWIMGQWNTDFNPMWKVSKAEFWTILSRALWWDMYEWSDPYYLSHLVALQENGILDDISDPEDVNISRWDVITALMRSINGVSYSPLLFSEDLEDYYDTKDPEIECLMIENNLSEKEKEVIRLYVDELEKWFYEKIDHAFDSLAEDDEWQNYLSILDNSLKTFDTIKKDFNKYLSDYKNLYETLNVDISDISPYTPGEKYIEMKKLITSLTKVIDNSIEMLNFVKEVCVDWKCNSDSGKEEIKEKYRDKIDEIQEKYEEIMEEFNDAIVQYNEYIEGYKLINKYWRIYEDSLINPEGASYLPKDAVSVSWYLVWEDYTRYQGDINDWKLEGNWVLTYWNYYYSGEWKNNIPNWFWEFKWNGFYYKWHFRNWELDWYWVYSNEDYSYTWEWVSWKKHWKGEYTADDFYYSWEWKFDEIVNWKIIYPNGISYEWSFKDEDYHWTGKLTLSSKDVYEWEFYYWNIYWYGKLTLANWEVFSWEWEDWLLSGQGVYIKDWKAIVAKKIDIIENQWNDTIIITDWTDTLTMMNKNIWATEVWTWEASYGSVFKWWNNTEFNSLDTWDSKEFIEAGTWEWGEKAQGPCPSWYHIPTVNEWEWIANLWKLKSNTTILDSWDVKSLMDTFKLPYAWYRYWYKAVVIPEDFSWSTDNFDETTYDGFALRHSDDNIYVGWRFWSSNTRDYWDGSSYMFYWFHIINREAKNDNYQEHFNNVKTNEVAYPIRCFKD